MADNDELVWFEVDLNLNQIGPTIQVMSTTPTPDEIGPSVPTLFCVVYRTGGVENFQWHRTLAMTEEEVIEALRSVGTMGYVCHIERYFASLAIGLPKTYAPDFPLQQEWH